MYVEMGGIITCVCRDVRYVFMYVCICVHIDIHCTCMCLHCTVHVQRHMYFVFRMVRYLTLSS